MQFLFKKKLRLTSASDYKRIFADVDFRVAHPNLLILVKKNKLSCSRVGLVVAKKWANRAVDRNRVKRIIRERFRLFQKELLNYDLVFIARQGIVKIERKQMHQVFQRQLERVARLCCKHEKRCCKVAS